MAVMPHSNLSHPAMSRMATARSLGSTAVHNASKHKHKQRQSTGSNVFVAFWNFFTASHTRPTCGASPDLT